MMDGIFGGPVLLVPQHCTVIGDISNDVGTIIKYRGDLPQMAFEQQAEAQRRLNRRQMGNQMAAVQNEQGYRQSQQTAALLQPQLKILQPKEQSMFGEFKQDMKNFIKEHKSIIYWIVLLYVADKFLFEGKFKVKINEILHRLVGKMDSKLDEIGAVVNKDAK